MKKSKGEDNGRAGRASADPPAAQTQFERFEEFARRIVSVPKTELQEQERLYRDRRRTEKK